MARVGVTYWSDSAWLGSWQNGRQVREIRSSGRSARLARTSARVTHCPFHTNHPCTGYQLAIFPNRACSVPLVLETDFEKVGSGRAGLGFIGLSKSLE